MTTIAAQAARAISMTAVALTHTAGPNGTTWLASADTLSATAHRDGKLGRVTLWHVQNNTAQRVQVGEYAPGLLAALDEVCDLLNDSYRTDSARWHYSGIARERGVSSVIGRAEFWLLTPEAAAANNMA
ncbi:hypothetical protein ITP53_11425 [Nonomuraea sp. K274]|uniref:Uncharacterized protein n=1 Tax=Nonomuraea cypriaca TaxID=1187855 RepID=A0A931EW53_9ACTN|nr:hypothetical protein [Nonomuraea cypriaca]MBF8186349.1 hypothetical protein [Nonomuraea cypriaca]